MTHNTAYESIHGGESGKWRIPLKKKTSIQVRLFDISVNTGQICMGFEADTPAK